MTASTKADRPGARKAEEALEEREARAQQDQSVQREALAPTQPSQPPQSGTRPSREELGAEATGLEEDSFDKLLAEAARVSEVAMQGTLPKAGEVIDEKFRIEQILGQGGMGAVYAATNLMTEREVALKWLLPGVAGKPEALARFLREARAAGRIRHPNVVDVYDVGHSGDAFYIVMERLHGEPLDERMKRGKMEPGEALSVIMPALRGVAAAHAQGVVHRDLKPANIYLTHRVDGTPTAKVLDFGVSKVRFGDGDSAITRDGAVMGTPAFMSPEQLRSSKEVDSRSDVYSFGVILYAMLGGQLPFRADSYAALVLKIAHEDPEVALETLCPEAPEGLIAVVRRAMARDPDERYEDIAALAAALEPYSPKSFRTTTEVPGPQQSVAPRLDAEHHAPPAAVQRSSNMPWIALAALVVLVGAVFFYAAHRGRRAQESAPVDGPPAAVVAPAPAAMEPTRSPTGAVQALPEGVAAEAAGPTAEEAAAAAAKPSAKSTSKAAATPSQAKSRAKPELRPRATAKPKAKPKAAPGATTRPALPKEAASIDALAPPLPVAAPPAPDDEAHPADLPPPPAPAPAAPAPPAPPPELAP